MSLTASQKKYLKGLCHHLQPVVTVATKGLTDNVLSEIDQALEHHELIKVRLRQDREARKASASEIASIMRAEIVMAIGQIVCYYRANPRKASTRRLSLPRGSV